MPCCINCVFKYCHTIKLKFSLTLLINEDRSGTQPGDGSFFKLLKIFFSKYLRNKYKYFHTIYNNNTNLSPVLLLLVIWFTMFCTPTEYLIYSINSDQPSHRRYRQECSRRYAFNCSREPPAKVLLPCARARVPCSRRCQN